MADRPNNVPDRPQPGLLVNLLGLGLPGAVTRQANARDERDFQMQRDRIQQTADLQLRNNRALDQEAFARNQPLFDAQVGSEQALTGQRQAQTDLYRVQIGQLPLELAARQSQLQREMAEFTMKGERDLRKEINADPVILKAQTALTSFDQLVQALDQNNRIALQSAIVALVQVQEPGLAVRNDDRIAYTGNQPATIRLIDKYNDVISGKVTADIKDQFIGLGTAVARPVAGAAQRVLQDYEGLVRRTPGMTTENVLLGTGLDFALMQAILGE